MHTPRRVIKRTLYVVMIATTVAGCAVKRSTFSNSVYQNSQVSYRIGELPEGFRRVTVGGADVAWISSDDDALIFANSQCDDSADVSLEALSGHLQIGLTDRTIISQIKRPMAGREALEVVLDAKLDGVARRMKFFVLKKDGCVYDIILSVTPERYDTYLPAYDSVVNGFYVGARP